MRSEALAHVIPVGQVDLESGPEDGIALRGSYRMLPLSRRLGGLQRSRWFLCLRELRVKFAVTHRSDQYVMTTGSLSSDGTTIAFLPFSNSIGFDPTRTKKT